LLIRVDCALTSFPTRRSSDLAIRPDAMSAISAAAVGADPQTGTLKGVVTFKGKPPVLKPLVKKGDPALKEEDRAICAAEDLPDRSEEHTSELQSLAYLVCRLL